LFARLAHREIQVEAGLFHGLKGCHLFAYTCRLLRGFCRVSLEIRSSLGQFLQLEIAQQCHLNNQA